jgi:hypothetical protein
MILKDDRVITFYNWIVFAKKNKNVVIYTSRISVNVF